MMLPNNNLYMNNMNNNNQINPMMNNQMNEQFLMNMIMFQNQMNHIINNNINQNENENENEENMLIFFNIAYDNIFKSITDQKKNIIFKVLKGKTITKHIPIYFTKKELYSLVNGVNVKKTILFYENNILSDDDSSINDIRDNSTILLFFKPSYNNFRESSLYKYLSTLYGNSQKINVLVDLAGRRKLFIFFRDFSISLMLKLFIAVLDTKSTDAYFVSGSQLHINDNRKIGDLFWNDQINVIISETENLKATYFTGKKIKATIIYKNKNLVKSFFVYKYSPISLLFKFSIKGESLENKKIVYNENILNKNDKHSFASLGIDNDFICFIID